MHDAITYRRATNWRWKSFAMLVRHDGFSVHGVMCWDVLGTDDLKYLLPEAQMFEMGGTVGGVAQVLWSTGQTHDTGSLKSIFLTIRPQRPRVSVPIWARTIDDAMPMTV